MLRLIGAVLTILFMSLSNFSGLRSQQAADDLTVRLLAPEGGWIGQVQTWYLSLQTPGEAPIRGLRIVDASSGAWSIQSIDIDALEGAQVVKVHALAVQPGKPRPSLLLSYQMSGKSYQQVVTGEPVAVQTVENALTLQLVSASEEVQRGEPVQLNLLIENRSPFLMNVSYQLPGGSFQPIDIPASHALQPGEKLNREFKLRMLKSGAPTIQARYSWIDEGQQKREAWMHVSAGRVTYPPESVNLINENNLGIILGGLISLVTALVAFFGTHLYEAVMRKRKDRKQAEGLIQMVLLHYKQAYACRDIVESKFLDDLLQNSGLYDVLRKQGLVQAAHHLWNAGQLYNRSMDSAAFSEQSARLDVAIKELEQKLAQRKI